MLRVPRWIAGMHDGAQDAVEKVRGDGTIGDRRDRHAWFGQIAISLRVERRTVASSGRHPFVKVLRWYRGDGKVHVGKAAAAVLRREPAVDPSVIGLHIQVRRHPSHGVDLAAKLWHEEAVHHPGGGQLETDRGIYRDGQLVDARNAEF